MARLIDCLSEIAVLNQAYLDKVTPYWRELEISSVVLDSREVTKGSLFAAIPGLSSDGHDFIKNVKDKGAVAALVERIDLDLDFPQIQVEGVRHSLGPVCASFYGTKEDDGVSYLAVTGTDGKTSTNQMLTFILAQAGHTVGSIGTPGITYPGYKSEHGSHTTPDSPALHATFKTMKEHGCDVIGMEASSHALDQERLRAIPFKAAIFTNLSHEHLDYHQTMDAYARAKRRLFEDLNKDCVAILNRDDERYIEFSTHASTRVISYGEHEDADYRITDLEQTLNGVQYTLKTKDKALFVQTKLYGAFNAWNLTAAIAAVVESFSIPIEDVLSIVKRYSGVPGRMQAVQEKQNFAVIVDFAVTPRAIEHALKTVRELKPKRIFMVMSSAGERDKTRRPRISQLMNELADEVILTSDLVFGENITSIVKDLSEYIDPNKLHVIYSRQEAMRYAIDQAEEGDAVLICGLGDIRFLIINGEEYYHDDYEYARHCVTERVTREILQAQVEAAGKSWQ